MDVRESAISVLRSLPTVPDATATALGIAESKDDRSQQQRLVRRQSWESATTATTVSGGRGGNYHGKDWRSSATSEQSPGRQGSRRSARRTSVSTLASMPSGDPRAALKGLGLGVGSGGAELPAGIRVVHRYS